MQVKRIIKHIKSTNKQHWKKKREKKPDETNITRNEIMVEQNPPAPTRVPLGVDVVNEKKKVESAIVSVIKNKKDNLEPKLQQTLRTETKIEITCLADTLNPLNSCKYTARITCPICDTVIKINKAVNANSSSCEWIISNLRRHVNGHLDIKPNSKERKTANSSVQSYSKPNTNCAQGRPIELMVTDNAGVESNSITNTPYLPNFFSDNKNSEAMSDRSSLPSARTETIVITPTS